MQIWMRAEEVHAKVAEILQVAEQCKAEFYQYKKNSSSSEKSSKGVLTKEKAEEIIEKVRKPLASLQLAPGANCVGRSVLLCMYRHCVLLLCIPVLHFAAGLHL